MAWRQLRPPANTMLAILLSGILWFANIDIHVPCYGGTVLICKSLIVKTHFQFDVIYGKQTVD